MLQLSLKYDEWITNIQSEMFHQNCICLLVTLTTSEATGSTPFVCIIIVVLRYWYQMSDKTTENLKRRHLDCPLASAKGKD